MNFLHILYFIITLLLLAACSSQRQTARTAEHSTLSTTHYHRRLG